MKQRQRDKNEKNGIDKNLAREAFAAQVTPETLDEESRTVNVVWFTGGAVPRVDWATGQPYMMTFDPKGVQLDRLNNGGPVLNAHSDWSMSDQVGVIDKAWSEGGQYLATMRFSKRPEVDGIWGDIRDRIIQNFSMGVFILEKKDITKETDKQKTVLVTKWEPYEISLVPVPADANTTTLDAEAPEVEEQSAKPWMIEVLRREVEVLALR